MTVNEAWAAYGARCRANRAAWLESAPRPSDPQYSNKAAQARAAWEAAHDTSWAQYRRDWTAARALEVA